MTQSIVLITGCSSGIGEETARYFAEKNWKVVATARDISTLTELNQLEQVEIFPLDVTNQEDIQRVAAHIEKKYGMIHALVHNAGYGTVGPFEASSREDVSRQFDVNVFGIIDLTRELLPYLREGKGTVLAVSSIGGRLAFPLYSLYHSTKWALEGLFESLQYELREIGVQVRLVEPGPVNTEFNGRSQKVLKKPNLNIYNSFVAKVYPRLQEAGMHGIPPQVVAKTIYRAVNQKSRKLRYVVPGSRSLMFARAYLPESVWRRIMTLYFRI